jgi:hypothetical protein
MGYRVDIDTLSCGVRDESALFFRDLESAEEYARLVRADIPGLRVSATVSKVKTPAERIAHGARRMLSGRGQARYGARIITNTLKNRGKAVDIRFIDADTLTVARLVADAEGISLEQAIRDQIELFG